MEYQDGIDPAEIETEEQLANFLAGLMFTSRPVPLDHNQRHIQREGGYHGQPQRYVLAQEQHVPGLTLPTLIAIEDQALCIYYYEKGNELFRLLETLPGEQDAQEISEKICMAMSGDAILERLTRPLEPVGPDPASAASLHLSPISVAFINLWITFIAALTVAVVACFASGVLLPMLLAQNPQAVHVGFPFEIGVFDLTGFPPGIFSVTHCLSWEVCDRGAPIAFIGDLTLWFAVGVVGLLLNGWHRKTVPETGAARRPGLSKVGSSWPAFFRAYFSARTNRPKDAPEIDLEVVDSSAQTKATLQNFRFLVENYGFLYRGVHRNHYDYLTDKVQIQVERENTRMHVSVLRAGEPSFTRLTLELIVRYFGQGELLEAGDAADRGFEANLQSMAGLLERFAPKVVNEIDEWWLPAVKYQFESLQVYYQQRNQLNYFLASFRREREYLKRKGAIR